MPIETDTGCISCRQCAQKCPAGAISLKNPADTDLSICISCMRCISACPQNAKHLNSDILQMMSERMAPLFAGRKPNELFL